MIVRHQPSVPPATIQEVLDSSGLEHFIFEAWHDDDWPSVDEISALIVMGGTMNVDQVDEFPFVGRSRRHMADALEREVPTLGVCLGSQMMARVLGAEVRRSVPRNAGFSPLALTEEGTHDPVIAPFAGGTPVLQFHEDTFALPEGATALASSSASGLYQAFRYGTNAYAVQFHFEVTSDVVEGWCRNIGEEALVAGWGVSSSDLMQQMDRHLPAQLPAGKELVRRFLVRAELLESEELVG